MMSTPDRQAAVRLIQEAVRSGARKRRACAELGLTLRTFERWTRNGGVASDSRPVAVRPVPANALSAQERTEHSPYRVPWARVMARITVFESPYDATYGLESWFDRRTGKRPVYLRVGPSSFEELACRHWDYYWQYMGTGDAVLARRSRGEKSTQRLVRKKETGARKRALVRRFVRGFVGGSRIRVVVCI